MRNNNLILALLSLTFLVVMVIYMFTRFEVTYSTFDSYNEMESIPNIFEASWVPGWLPKTASEIKESHDVDTNEAWLVFNFSPSDRFYKSCQEMEYEHVLLPQIRQSVRYPEFVRKLTKKIRTSTEYFYQCGNDSSRFLAIDHENMRGFIWTRPH